MKYSFNDIVNEELYSTARVVMVTGQYNIFNNIVVDELRDRCKSVDAFEEDAELLAEFGVATNNSDNNVSNSVDFSTFMDIIDTPNINGRWFCSVDLAMLNKKQIEKMDSYIRNPSPNGILVIVAQEYMGFRQYLKNKALLLGATSHIIQLGFPNRKVLVKLIIKLFEKRTVKIGEQSAELFVNRMSNAYDDYEAMIDKLCLGYKDAHLSFKQVQEGLKGVNNYILDDFISQLTEPIEKDAVKTNRKIYKMLESLLKDIGPVELVKKLRYKINDYIEFRLAINNGTIPIKVKFSVYEAKAKLGEKHPLSRIPDFRFRQMAITASMTSLKDWTYMKMLLGNLSNFMDKASSEKALYSLVHRVAFSQNRLNNDLGIESIIDDEVEFINNIRYIDKAES